MSSEAQPISDQNEEGPQKGTLQAFVCEGCSIGECLDTEKLAGAASAELGDPAKVRPALCLPENVEALKQELKGTSSAGVVLAACSQRVNFDVFSPGSLEVDAVERVNIRELVAWTKPAQEEETQLLAEDYLKMGIAKAKTTQQPHREPKQVVEQGLLVVGGGIAGITAATEAAEAGRQVFLVEKEDELGGWVAKLHKIYPTRTPFRDLEAVPIAEKIEAVKAHSNVQVFTSAEVKEAAGEPGDFKVRIEQNGNDIEVKVGAIVLATGWKPHEDAPKLKEWGYGSSANVVTNVQFEEMARSGNIVRPSDGKSVGRVAFVQRPGLSEQHAFSYGVNTVDLTAMKQALYLREENPDAKAYIIYEDLNAPGLYEDFYRRVQQEPNIYFTKGEVAAISEIAEGDLVVEMEHSLVGERVGVKVDLVVLAVGMVPVTADSAVLNLLYRQGPGVPKAKFGFSDSNFICFPYETQRTGIYAAGSVREALDISLSIEDATGAALKAIQSIELISRGAATHPRSGDLSLPHTRTAGCTKCGRCTIECPFSAIELDDKQFPMLNPDRCRRCGICMGACPVQVISFEDYSVDHLTAMINAIDLPEDPEKPRIVALVCENDAYPAFDMAGINRLSYEAGVRVIPLRCLGSLNAAVVANALSRGVDGLMLMGCKSGDDYQCHFIKGSELAQKRLENIQETLDRLMLESERVNVSEVEITDYDQIPDKVRQFTEEIKAMGPNPFKGF